MIIEYENGNLNEMNQSGIKIVDFMLLGVALVK